MRRRLFFYLLALAVVVGDRFTKLWAVAALGKGHTIAVLPGYVALNLVRNRGSAFGILDSGAVPLAVVASAAIVAMVLMERRGFPGRAIALGVALLLGGAAGNLIDRVHLGYVIDFVELDWHGRNIWPVFNMADSAITVGAAILALTLWRSGKREDAAD